MAPTRRQILRALAFGVAVPGCVSIDTGCPRPPRATCVPADSPYWAPPAFPPGTPSPTPGNPLPEALPPVTSTSEAAQ